jgi:hypothetical protein
VKSIAFILSFIFLSFVAGPTIISLIDDSVDMSFAFTANEEENSSKNEVSFEILLEKDYSNYRSIQYLRSNKGNGYSYQEDYHRIYLEVVSPPPKHTYYI